MIAALLFVHKKCKMVDHEAVSELEDAFRPAEQHADEKSVLAARGCSERGGRGGRAGGGV